MLGFRFSEESKILLSEKRKGEKNSFYNKSHSQETKNKISKANKNRKMSEEFCKRLCKKHNFKKEEFEEYFKIVQEKFNEIPSDQEIASQECKQSQIKNQVIETLEKVILDIKTLK